MGTKHPNRQVLPYNKFIGRALAGLGKFSFLIYRLPRLPNEPAAKASQGRLGILGKHILMAVLGNLGRWPRICWHSRQMVHGNLGRWPRICWHSRQMVQGFLAYGPGFLGKWCRICRQMAKNLSIATSFPSPVDLRDKMTTSPKVGKE